LKKRRRQFWEKKQKKMEKLGHICALSWIYEKNKKKIYIEKNFCNPQCFK
jgi:hypothetical protein